METNISDQTTEVVSARCECCGLTEECTDEYINRVREHYSGLWICGLCSEAVKDEIARSKKEIKDEEALNRHMSFCKKFKNLSPPKNPTEELICALKQLLMRSIDSPRSSPVAKPGNNNNMISSRSCRPALDSAFLQTN